MFDLFTCVLSYGSRKWRMKKVNLDISMSKDFDFFRSRTENILTDFLEVRSVLDSPIDCDLLLVPEGFFFFLRRGFFPALYKFPPPPFSSFSSPPSTAQTLVPTRNKCSPFHSIQTAKSRQLWDRWERRKESGSIKPPLPPRSTAGFWVLPKRHELVLSTHSHIHTHQPTRTLTHERKVSSFSDGLVLILRPYNYNNGYNSRLSEEKI